MRKGNRIVDFPPGFNFVYNNIAFTLDLAEFDPVSSLYSNSIVQGRVNKNAGGFYARTIKRCKIGNLPCSIVVLVEEKPVTLTLCKDDPQRILYFYETRFRRIEMEVKCEH